MEKFRIGIFLVFLLVVSVLTFSLTKSWKIYESGYEVTVESSDDKEKDKEIPNETTGAIDLEDGTGRVLWKQFFLYPIGLLTEAGGFGPEGIMSHSRNLISLNLKTGSTKRLFPRNVYVWDFFPGDFSKKIVYNNIDEPKEDTLSLERRLVILAATVDSNADGVLNHKDYKRLYLYDPDKEVLTDVMPAGYQFRKIIFNTQKNQLVLVVKKIPEISKASNVKPDKMEKTEEKPLPLTIHQEIFSFDINTGVGQLSGSLEE